MARTSNVLLTSLERKMHANVCIKTFWTFDPEGHRDMTFISYMSLTVPSVSIEINARASIGSVYNTCALRILF